MIGSAIQIVTFLRLLPVTSSSSSCFIGQPALSTLAVTARLLLVQHSPVCTMAGGGSSDVVSDVITYSRAGAGISVDVEQPLAGGHELPRSF